MTTLVVLLALTGVFLLGSSRLSVSIRLVAIQGILLGIAALLSSYDHLTFSGFGAGISGIVLKGIALPWLLFFVLRKSGARREIEPYVGFSASMLIGILLLGLSAWIAWRMEVIEQGFSSILFTVALFLLLAGLFLIITRRKAITQTLGYLVMENGVYAMGVGVGNEFSFLLEIGVLLDVFVGVFLMGIMIFRIDREFEHIDTDRFTELRDVVTERFTPEHEEVAR